MNSIVLATEKDCNLIAAIGRVSVTEAHKDSCAAEILNEFVETNYNDEAIKRELSDENNIYHIINYNDQPAGFSKIVFNAKHPNIELKNVTKLDRIYTLSEFHGTRLGYELLMFNIELAKENAQSGIWLYTWTGNKKAIDFYSKAGFKITGNHNFLVAQNHYNPNYQMFLNFSESQQK